jgi:hypothetical protein
MSFEKSEKKLNSESKILFERGERRSESGGINKPLMDIFLLRGDRPNKNEFELGVEARWLNGDTGVPPVVKEEDAAFRTAGIGTATGCGEAFDAGLRVSILLSSSMSSKSPSIMSSW